MNGALRKVRVSLVSKDRSARMIAKLNERKGGRATTYVAVERDGGKRERGATVEHESWDAAVSEMDRLVEEATGKGWLRAGHAPAHDTFSLDALPTP